MKSITNPFEQFSGSDRIQTPLHILMLVALLVMSAWITSNLGIVGGLGLFILPFIFTYLYLLFRFPIIGLFTAIALGFIILGLGRYIPGSLGLAMDGTLILTFIALIFNRFYEGIDWSLANKDITYLSAIWFAYTLFEVLNPEARSIEAWFSGRGVSFYMFMIVPLTLIFINSDRKIDFFLYLWGIFSILATLKGIMQMKFGVDPWEQAWLDAGNYKTHILFGKLRVFSFMSDAGQFGGNQAYTAVVATIVSMAHKKWLPKLFFIILALFSFYGMVISGTRGSMGIPLAGFMAFFVLRKNIRVLSIGISILVVVFIFFAYTSIGQGNDQIRRMRTAFDPNDASFQVRLDNQKILKGYLASRPFGGGIGHGGVKAQKYLPNAFLSQVATDSWYVLIWVEQGIVGLLIHLFILFYVIGVASFRIMFRIRDPILKMKMAALASGMFGVMVASYGNAVLGGMPTGMLIYTSMALLMNTEVLDKPAEEFTQDLVAA
jgi:O-Antigen ligase